MDIQNQEIIGSATYSELVEAADILAENKTNRLISEERIRQALPEGHSIGIDIFGIIHIMSPLST